jgi:osmotically-inducible protein OsmY
MPNMLDVAVKDGTVELNGAITDERMRNALIVAAENTPGVKAVRDHLAWIEPMSGVVIEADGTSADVRL